MHVISRSETDTRALGARLAKKITKPLLIALIGDFGAGKTVFVKGLAQGLGIQGAAKVVTSPSFVILHIYKGPRALFHMDLYRIADTASLAKDIDYQEFLEHNVVAIEWADKMCGLLPKEYLKVNLRAHGSDTRRITFTARGAYPKKILSRFAKDKKLL
jgi:tRNA threonylcarbamoyladenosine biosynthesis protein TsaE